MRVRHTLSTMLSPKQNLTFTQLKIYYQEKGYDEVKNEYFLENLEMYTEDRKYNYLAYLLSDNNNISIIVAKYQNDDFVERNDYVSCCLITAINRVLDKLNIENKTGIKITGDAKRKEKPMRHKEVRYLLKVTWEDVVVLGLTQAVWLQSTCT